MLTLEIIYNNVTVHFQCYKYKIHIKTSNTHSLISSSAWRAFTWFLNTVSASLESRTSNGMRVSAESRSSVFSDQGISSLQRRKYLSKSGCSLILCCILSQSLQEKELEGIKDNAMKCLLTLPYLTWKKYQYNLIKTLVETRQKILPNISTNFEFRATQKTVS